MNNARKTNGRTPHTHVTATDERRAKVVSEFAAEEERRREYQADVAASRERGALIARGEVPPVALHDDRGHQASHDDPPVRVVGSGGSRANGNPWQQLAERAQMAIRADLGARAERTIDPDAPDREPKAVSVAKFGPSTPPK